ncbi:MAG: Ppx/GppA family phosphatase [Alphaproteobacteria bacterium]|nr:Ppx/GppA family phosphatase [Alphaproteobacteria bacterium]
MRVGAIDVGTNSIHLLVADVAIDGTWKVVEAARKQVELGANGLAKNVITPSAFQRGLEAMAEFQEAARSMGAEDIHCAATSAVREAENGEDWVRAVREETGIRVRTITGREEGRLIYLGVRSDLDFSLGRVMLMDLGGGSTEFILCDSEKPTHIESLPLGHIRLADAFHRSDPMSKVEYDELKAHIKTVLKPLTSSVKGRDFRTLVGTSGTMRCLAMMATLARGDQTPDHAHGLVMTSEELDTLVKRLRATTFEGLLAIPGMDPRRQRTITAGAILVRQVMRAFDHPRMITSERSLRDGLIVDWIIRNRPEIDLIASIPDPRARSIERLMERYGADREHAHHVETLCLQLFDGLAPVHRMGFGEREMLRFAALVHDIGHHISGKNHNKHGQYLIRNTRMHGFTLPEVDVLASIVRYHRGGKPKSAHPEFAALSSADRHRVRVLAGIIRLADALDRSHDGVVDSLTVELGDGIVRVRATAASEAHLERWAANRRTDLLAGALRQEVRITIDPAGEAADERRVPIG